MNNFKEQTFSSEFFTNIDHSDNLLVSKDEELNLESLTRGNFDRYLEVGFIVKNLLPQIEKEIIMLIYNSNFSKKQREISEYLGIKQEMVAYYKKRALKRIKYFTEHRKVDVQRMQKKLSEYITTKQLEAILLYFKYHSQKKIANKLKITQPAVSSRIKLAFKELEKMKEGLNRNGFLDKESDKNELLEYFKIFQELITNNSLFEIKEKPALRSKKALKRVQYN